MHTFFTLPPVGGFALLDEGDARHALKVLRLRAGEPVDDAEVATGPRIGITRAAEVPWRWWVGGNPHVSGPRRAGG